ncbi:uncharacterized protein LOC130680156 isoform X2 [Manis pentadactyla]|uniref:uncharacterized protein LOC130680156 isoform X2 n=1 Tax=Manis pentadactyla TaxID=143292 RepID=UPI00255CC10A|nr:uncharacterized protein LOC130680156 isoform X2 [Manis pentadactyla]
MPNMIVHSTYLFESIQVTENASSFFYIPSSEFEKTQGDSPEPEAQVVVGDYSHTREQSSASEYFSRASSPGQLRAAAEDRITQLPEDVPRVGALEMTPPQVWEEWEASSSSPSSSSSSSSSSSASSSPSSPSSSSSSASSSSSSPVPVSQQGESSLFPQHMDTAPIREIYYRRVFLKRDVTVWWGGVEVLEPTSKKTKLVQCVFPQAARKTSGPF